MSLVESAQNQRRLRRIVRVANAKKRLRVELRKLPDDTLLRRLGKYQGRTASQVRAEYAVPRWAALAGYGRKDDVVDAIVRYEVPE